MLKLLKKQSTLKLYYYTTLSTLFLILICFSILFGMIVTKAKENTLQANADYLNARLQNAEEMISQLHQSMTQMTTSRTLLHLVITNEENTKTIAPVMQDLALTDQNNNLIQNAYLYVPSNSLLLGSDYEITFSESVHKMIESYLHGDITDLVTYEDGLRFSHLYIYQDQLYLSRDFPLDGTNRLGILFYKVNTKYLLDTLTKGMSSPDQLQLFSESQIRICHSSSRDTIAADMLNEIITGTAGIDHQGDSKSSYYKKDHTYYFYDESELFHLKFVYQKPAGDVLSVPSLLHYALVPILILAVLIVLFGYLLFISGRYLPSRLSRLATLTAKTDADFRKKAETVSEGNTFEQIEDRLQNIYSRQMDLQDTVSRISPNIESHLLADLLSGLQSTEEQVRHTLEIAHSSLEINAFYLAAILFFNGDVTTITKKKRAFHQELDLLLDQFCKSYQAQYRICTLENSAATILLSFQSTDSIIKVFKEIGDLEPLLISPLSHKYDCDIRLSIGKVYYSLLDIGLSYKSALENQGKIKSENSDTAGAKKIAGAEEGLSSTDEKERSFQIVDLLINNDLKGAQNLYARTLQELTAKYVQNPQNTRLSAELSAAYQKFLQGLSNDIASIEYINFSDIPNSLFFHVHQEEMMSEDFIKSAGDNGRQLLEMVAALLKKQEHPYITASRKYIEKNFEDSNLSLNTVAEAIGVNASYLSKLYKTNLNVNFTEFLNRYRISQGKLMLSDTDCSINDISLKCGFNSAQNFIRVFKKLTGQTPGEFRKKSR